MRIVITGGDGLIAGVLRSGLLAANAEWTPLDGA